MLQGHNDLVYSYLYSSWLITKTHSVSDTINVHGLLTQATSPVVVRDQVIRACTGVSFRSLSTE